MTNFDMSSYFRVYLDEANEQLQILEEGILRLEQDTSNMETVQMVFRAAHTLKGSSAAMGYEPMKELTHHIENVFDLIRNQQLLVETDLINLLFECIDYLKIIKEAIKNGTIEKIDIQPFITRLERLKDSSLPSTEKNKNALIKKKQLFPKVIIDSFQQEVIFKALETNYNVFAVFVSLVEDVQFKKARSLIIHNNLKDNGEIIASFPSIECIENDDDFSGNLVFILITEEKEQKILKVVSSTAEIQSVSITQISKDNINHFSNATY